MNRNLPKAVLIIMAALYSLALALNAYNTYVWFSTKDREPNVGFIFYGYLSVYVLPILFLVFIFPMYKILQKSGIVNLVVAVGGALLIFYTILGYQDFVPYF